MATGDWISLTPAQVSTNVHNYVENLKQENSILKQTIQLQDQQQTQQQKKIANKQSQISKKNDIIAKLRKQIEDQQKQIFQLQTVIKVVFFIFVCCLNFYFSAKRTRRAGTPPSTLEYSNSPQPSNHSTRPPTILSQWP